MIMHQGTWKIGELAKQTGITVRTLHHYHSIGLLSPSEYTEAGHRLYTKDDISKLQQIMSLKQLGFSLDEIKQFIENPNFDRLKVIKIQLESIKEHIRKQEQLFSRLEGLYEMLNSRQDVEADYFIKLIEVIHMNVEKYFTQEQLEKMKMQTEQFSSEEKKQVESNWSELITNIRAEMEKGTSPEDPTVIQLARRWSEMINQFTGGDNEIVKAAERFHAQNPGNPLQFGIDRDLYKYIQKAMSHI
jgi:DNA-binding transcriptional MerR regulator